MKTFISACTAFFFVTLATAGTNADSPDSSAKSKVACQASSDCFVGITGCWQWVAVNASGLSKEKSPFDGNYIVDAKMACLAAVDPGPKLESICKKGICELKK